MERSNDDDWATIGLLLVLMVVFTTQDALSGAPKNAHWTWRLWKRLVQVSVLAAVVYSVNHLHWEGSCE